MKDRKSSLRPSKLLDRFQTLPVVLIWTSISILPLLSGCATRPVVDKPSMILTVPMDKPVPNEDTCRGYTEALIKAYAVIDEGNSRFKAINDK